MRSSIVLLSRRKLTQLCVQLHVSAILILIPCFLLDIVNPHTAHLVDFKYHNYCHMISSSQDFLLGILCKWFRALLLCKAESLFSVQYLNCMDLTTIIELIGFMLEEVLKIMLSESRIEKMHFLSHCKTELPSKHRDILQLLYDYVCTTEV